MCNSSSLPVLSAIAEVALLGMQPPITGEWLATLRQDVKDWDDLVQSRRKNFYTWKLWEWPDRTPPLKYTGRMAERVSMLRYGGAQALHCDTQGLSREAKKGQHRNSLRTWEEPT